MFIVVLWMNLDTFFFSPPLFPLCFVFLKWKSWFECYKLSLRKQAGWFTGQNLPISSWSFSSNHHSSSKSSAIFDSNREKDWGLLQTSRGRGKLRRGIGLKRETSLFAQNCLVLFGHSKAIIMHDSRWV